MATTIDAAWLITPVNGVKYGTNGPWGLTLANETYTLAVDVVADGTAFISKGAGQTFDLNGHSIVFGNLTQPALLNPYFSDNSIVPGLPDNWDVTGATAATVVSLSSATVNEKNGFAGWAINLLKLSTFLTTQVIKSATFTLPLANIEYCANVFARSHLNNDTAGLNLRIEVIDSVTGTNIALASPNLGNPWTNTVGLGEGYGEPYYFVPSTVANPVYLKFTVTPPTGLSTQVYMSGALCMTSRNYGIVATHGFAPGTRTSGPLGSIGLLPYQLWTQYSQVLGPVTIKDTAGAGSITCGKDTPSSSSLYVKSIESVITGIHGTSSGLDSIIVDCETGTSTISGCTLTDVGTMVSNRQRQKPSINFDRCGVAIVHDNVLTGCKHTGIYISEPNAGSSVYNNTISQDTRYTDGYGIVAADFSAGLSIYGNTITPTKGRGILLDNFSTACISLILHDNYIDVYEKQNLEYGPAGLETTALRVRMEHSATACYDFDIYDNTLIARTDSNGAHAAIALRPSVSTHTGGNPLNWTFRNNHCQAFNSNVLSSTSPGSTSSFYAVGCSIDRLDSPGGMSFDDNIFESNLIGLTLGDVDAFGLSFSGETFTGNTITRNTTTGYQGGGFLPLQIGTANVAIANTNLLGFSYSGTAGADFSSSLTWDNNAKLKVVNVGWLVTVTVLDALGAPYPNATVVTRNSSSTIDDTETTDVNGQCVVFCITDNWNQPGINSGGRTHISYAPHTLTVSSVTYPDVVVSLGSLTGNTSVIVPLAGGAFWSIVVGDSVGLPSASANLTKISIERSPVEWKLVNSPVAGSRWKTRPLV